MAVIVIPEPPAVAEVGLIEVRMGAGLVTVKLILPDTPPPGEGFVTVIVAVPPACRSVALTSAETASEFR